MTETTFILDSYAVLEFEQFAPPVGIGKVLNHLTDLVTAGSLRFPETVWKEVHRYAPSSSAGIWIKAASGQASSDRCPHSFEQVVLAGCEDLLDQTQLAGWQAQIQVAALALYLSDDPSVPPVTIVTGDYRPRPDRMNLQDASNVLRIAAIDSGNFISEVKAAVMTA